MAVSCNNPAVEAGKIVNRFRIRQQRVEVVVSVPDRTATATRLEADDRASVADELCDGLEVIIAARSPVKEQQRDPGANPDVKRLSRLTLLACDRALQSSGDWARSIATSGKSVSTGFNSIAAYPPSARVSRPGCERFETWADCLLV
jgi:hypothetical protein